MHAHDLDPESVQERHDRVVALTRQGKTAGEIAELMGMSKRGIQWIRHWTGCGQPAPKPLTDAEIDRARAMLEDGCSYSEVGRTLGRSNNNLMKRLPGYGWDRKQIIELAVATKRFNAKAGELR
jgi:DNA-binding CsgD family transcriptional regulator